MNPSSHLFAYGTLMPGGRFYSRIEHDVRGTTPGRVEGVLVDLGAYPALIAGEGWVLGVLLELDPAALAITDRIEGYVPERADSPFMRKEVEVLHADGEAGKPGMGLRGWVYEFTRLDRIADRPRLVVGDRHGIAVQAWRVDPRG